MKNDFGSLLLMTLLAVAGTTIAEPGETPYLSTSNDCGEPMGFIEGFTGSAGNWYSVTFIIVGTHPISGYYSKSYITSVDTMAYGSSRVDWDAEYGIWRSYRSSSYLVSECLNDFYTSTNAVEPNQLQDIPALYEELLGTSSGRYDLTADGAFGDYSDPPTKEEWLAAHEDYEVGDYSFNPSEYAFGDEKYDGLLSKTDKIKFNCDNVRPQTQRDYRLYFNLPIPGEGTQSFSVSVMPDTGTPAGAAMEIVRQLVRGISGVIFSYVFVKHVWLAIRQY